MASQGWASMKRRASAESMAPQEAVWGGTPTPRKLRAASARMALAMVTEATTMMGAVTLGRRCRAMMRSWRQPTVRAASM